MKKRPTIALAMIVKNEAHNLGPLIQSINGCFDAIFITDTGSTDGTVSLAQSKTFEELAGCPIYVSHFEWVHDFAKARQFSFDQVSEEYDYIAWMDGDDVLSDREKFIHFRDHTMHCSDAWLVNYNYAYAGDNPVCTFYRERIVRNNGIWKWNYFIHEGLVATEFQRTQFIGSWTVDHKRTAADQLADKARNLKIFENQISQGNELCPRMTYYYGKELFDGEVYLSAVQWLKKAVSLPADSGLQIHDRIMAMQTLSIAYGKCGEWEKALNVALHGLQLEPTRSEFWCCIGDALASQKKMHAAKLFYEGAKHCTGGNVGGALYTSPAATRDYPSIQLTQIYLSEFNVKAAQREVDLLKEMDQPVASEFQKQIDLINAKNTVPDVKNLTQVDDIVITTPPGTVVPEWDERVLKEKGLGGSETAAVEVAMLLKKKTGRPVKIFMNRAKAEVMESGVEYIPLQQLEAYFRSYKPHRHIAWRHAHRLTEAPTFVWSHDLITQNSQHGAYNKLWCLTEFHKHFYQDMTGIPAEKIDIVNNGINPDLYRDDVAKIPGKVIFSSSPDRGWAQSVEICRLARKEIPNLELHLFYGTANMRKMGMENQADELDRLIRDNDFVHYHGFVSKKELAKHFMESEVWLYPADFIETSCITAMEAVCAGAFPLVRNMGALPYTLEGAQCEILDENPTEKKNHQFWADRLVYHLKNESWKTVERKLDEYSWENRIDGYIQSMNL